MFFSSDDFFHIYDPCAWEIITHTYMILFWLPICSEPLVGINSIFSSSSGSRCIPDDLINF